MKKVMAVTAAILILGILSACGTENENTDRMFNDGVVSDRADGVNDMFDGGIVTDETDYSGFGNNSDGAVGNSMR